MENIQESGEKPKSKIKPIFLQYVRNIESIEIFFDKLSHKANEEDRSISDAQQKYFEESLKSSLGDEFYEKFKQKLEEKKDNSSVVEVHLNEEDGEDEFEDFEEIFDEEQSEEAEESNNKITSKPLPKDKIESFFYKLYKAPNIQIKNFEILANGTFLMLNNYFEYLFADLLSFHFSNNKNIIEEKNISISLSELKNFSTIEEAYKDLLFKEIEKLLLDLNFEEVKDYFKKLDVSLAEQSINWELINEIRERRHLVVHNNSIVNQKYLNKSKNIFDLKVGDTVNIKEEYLKNAIDEILFAGSLLIANCWGKWEKEFAPEAISDIMILTFDLLKRNNYDLVIRICMYVEKNIKPKGEEEDTCVLHIKFNHCIALKRLSKTKELNTELAKIRVGNLTPIYKLAKSILGDENDEVRNIFKQAIIVDEIIIDQYYEWPLFEDLRTNTELNEFCLSQFIKS